jgi:hypothetical protein
LGKEVVPITNGCTEVDMVTVNDLVAVSLGADESATCTVKVDDPAVVGVPESVPPLLRLRPAGKVPAETLQEYGVKPPVAASVVEYAVPVVPPGSDEVVMESGCTEVEMVTVNDLVAVSLGDDESATCTVNVEEPAVVGVPESVPPLLRLRPAGKVPEATLQAYGVRPPDAARVVE